jgi:DNA-binding beta-propeller fold protein YncE
MQYAVRASYALPGPGRWDLLAVDPARGNVFVTRGDRVQVMDENGHLVGAVTGTEGAHGVAIVPELGRGFATNGRANSLSEFDLASFSQVRDIPLGGRSPDAVLYEPETRHLFVFDAGSDEVSVVDPGAGKELVRIKLDGNPELAASDRHGHVFVNIEDQEQLVAIDTASLAVDHTWKLSDCEGPTGLALDAERGRAFSACQNGALVVTDLTDGDQIARLPIGEGPDGAAFDPATKTIFVPGGRSGTLTVIREESADRYRVIQTLPTERSARTIALDESTHRLYLPAARFGPQPANGGRAPMEDGSFHVLAVW